ncbi:MAG: hypothetical protein JWL59_3382 [Chthoniobacteraceae bacterium]|nr:hypothetical protein [Chthoniobacteraceae bacterium]
MIPVIFSRFSMAVGRALPSRPMVPLWIMLAAALIGFPSTPLHAAPALESFYHFAVPPANPIGELVEAADGVFYGTTSIGGTFGAGTIFKLTADGGISTVVEFTDAGQTNRGARPGAGLVPGPNGALYGTTAKGGAYGVGTVFKLSPDGLLTTLVEFSGNGSFNRGASPYAALFLSPDGNFYGTTADGGNAGNGTLFRMTASGELVTLVDFTGNGTAAKGESPYGGLLQDADGFLYGTTAKGGAKGYGTIFKSNRSGVLTTLVEFSDNGALNKGSAPYATLAWGADGNLYGTTAKGGIKGNGTIFKVTPAGLLTTLAHFDGKGALPESALVAGPDGSFYGTTFGGGLHKAGTIFKLAADGTLHVLVDFAGKGGPDKGSIAQSALIMGQDGDLYGTTFSGGSDDAGTLFKLTTDGKLSTLAEFHAADPASNSQPGLVVGSDGNFYGATTGNGAGGKGTLFKLTTAGKFSTLVEFTGNGLINKGAAPMAPLSRAADGSLYGSSSGGGSADCGTIFKLAADGSISTLVEFSGNGATNKGTAPMGALLETNNGDWYGTTSKGGTHDLGTIFKLSAAGVLTTLIEFTGNGASNKGASPQAGLVKGADGNFYGATLLGGAKDLGTLFRLTPDGALTTLVEFADVESGRMGAYPYGPLLAGGDGFFYGTTSTGGVTGNGTVFKLAANGGLTTLVEFSDNRVPAKGSYPQGALFFGSDGYLYGTTSFGGASQAGTVFKVSTSGALTTLAEFSDGGAYPESGLIIGADSNLYGTTSGGGDNGAGSVFRLRIRALPIPGKPGGVQSHSARLNATIDSGTIAGSGAFEYGLTSTYGNLTPSQPVAAGSSRLTMPISGLLPNATYHYRTTVTDSLGAVFGADQTFTTEPMPYVDFGTGDLIGEAPDAARITGFGVPAIDDEAGVAVVAMNETGMAIIAGNPPVVVARKSDPAPLPDGSTSPTRRFVSFRDPVCGQAGAIAFMATIVDGKKSLIGLWSNASGILREVAVTGGAVEGVAGAQFKMLGSIAMSGTGTIFHTGTFINGQGGAGMGVWACDADGNHLLLRQGAPFLESSVSSFNVLGAVAGSPGQGRGYRGSTLSALVTLANRKQAVVHFRAGMLPEVVVATGDEVPYRSQASQLLGFGIPSVAEDRASAFLARLLLGPDGVTKLSDQAIFADTAKVDLGEIARKGAVAPGAGTATFAALSDPVYNAQFGIAFQARLTGAGVTAKNAAGIWWTSPTGLSLVARTGSEAAGVAGSTWSAFSSLALPDGAGPVFVAKLSAGTGGTALPDGVNASNNTGIWAVEAGGVVRLVVRTGDQVNVEGLPRTISLLTALDPVLGSPGEGRAYNTKRQLVCRVAFTDRTQAIVRFYLP